MRKFRSLTSRGLLAAALVLPVVVQADDYRWEAGGSYDRINVDGIEGVVSDFNLDNWGLYGTWYFNDVNTDQLPLQEAAYLGRVGSVSLTPSRFDSSVGHLDQWRLSSDFYWPNSWVYLGAGVTRSDTIEPNVDANGNFFVSRGHASAWDATVGITPFAGLRVSTSFYEDADYEPNVDVKYVGRLGNDHFYGFGLNLIDPDGGDLTYQASADYFIDRTLRVGGQLGEHHWGLSADKFFMEKLSVGLGYTDFDGGDAVTLRAGWRF